MTNTKIALKKYSSFDETTISLPASKSISNRVLIIDALCSSNSPIYNLSTARDTITMKRLLSSTDKTLDVLDAGTTMRFLTAYLTVTNQHKTITGTKRMCERPIKILVDALRTLGGQVEYLDKEGFPPLEISGLLEQKANEISIRGDVSSQYISALLMISPILPEGLKLNLEGKIGSRPYIEMTLQIMSMFGVDASWNQNIISIKNQAYKSVQIEIEPDWSGASYWYSFVALAESGEVLLPGLKEKSLQGDSVVKEIMTHLGVETTFTEKGAVLRKKDHKNEVSFNFTDCPDLAQTVAVVCAAKSIHCKMTGLESLKIKETDRILALQNELSKIGTQLIDSGTHYELIPSRKLPKHVTINTYDDHRMAMAFAPLATSMDVEIENPDVVNKSFPNFWQEVEKLGLKRKAV
ncbi:MAG: 3-phosphoshikimate 1-carboxyvinyltransferase [Fulvivirga sp.]